MHLAQCGESSWDHAVNDTESIAMTLDAAVQGWLADPDCDQIVLLMAEEGLELSRQLQALCHDVIYMPNSYCNLPSSIAAGIVSWAMDSLRGTTQVHK